MSEGITVYKFMVELRLYPNGKLYHKMFPIGSTKQEMGQKKKIVTKTLEYEEPETEYL